jgi:hypothetical protein
MSRKLTHDANVYFRAPAFIIEAAEAKAKRDGMNLSELMRHALRREVLERAV